MSGPAPDQDKDAKAPEEEGRASTIAREPAGGRPTATRQAECGAASGERAKDGGVAGDGALSGGAAELPQEPAEPLDDILCGLMTRPPRAPEHSHHYRCANFGLYFGCALLVLVGVIYYFVSHPPTEQPLRSLIALLAGLAAIVWALHYCSISYCIDSDGIRVRRLFGSNRSLRWSELRRWEVVRIIEPEQSTCRIIFSGEDGRPSITLSSELLDLEAVENLARELQGSEPV